MLDEEAGLVLDWRLSERRSRELQTATQKAVALAPQVPRQSSAENCPRQTEPVNTRISASLSLVTERRHVPLLERHSARGCRAWNVFWGHSKHSMGPN